MMDRTLTAHATAADHEQGLGALKTVPGSKRRRLTKGVATAVATVLAVAGFAFASPASAATSYYGETPNFHCATGRVVLDNIRIPTAELSATYYAAVDIWYGSRWQFYTYAQLPGGAVNAVISNGAQNENQIAMSASVLHGYYYAVAAVITSHTHSANAVQAQVDFSSPAYYGGYYCAA